MAVDLGSFTKVGGGDGATQSGLTQMNSLEREVGFTPPSGGRGGVRLHRDGERGGACDPRVFAGQRLA